MTAKSAKAVLKLDREEMETLFQSLFDARGELTGKRLELARLLLDSAARAGWELGSKTEQP